MRECVFGVYVAERAFDTIIIMTPHHWYEKRFFFSSSFFSIFFFFATKHKKHTPVEDLYVSQVNSIQYDATYIEKC